MYTLHVLGFEVPITIDGITAEIRECPTTSAFKRYECIGTNFALEGGARLFVPKEIDYRVSFK